MGCRRERGGLAPREGIEDTGTARSRALIPDSREALRSALWPEWVTRRPEMGLPPTIERTNVAQMSESNLAQMSGSANEQIALAWLAAVSAGDMETVRSTMAEDVDHQVPGTCLLSGRRTRDEVCEVLGRVNALTEDGIHLSVVNVTADDDRVAVEATGASLVKGVGPYDNSYHFFFRIHDGRIVQMKEYMDTKLVDDVFGPILAEMR